MAQVKVGDNPTTINPNSLLELESSNQGLLMPRVALTTSSDPSPLTAHIQGMTVYNTAASGDLTQGFYFNDGTKWVRLANNFKTVNGLHLSPNNELMLGGQLMEPTIIGTDPGNTLAITGLGNGEVGADEILTVDPLTGVVRKVTASSLVKEMEIVHFTSDGQTRFPTPFPVTNANKIAVYRNGVKIGLSLIDSNTIALESGVVCNSGDEIRIVQIY